MVAVDGADLTTHICVYTVCVCVYVSVYVCLYQYSQVWIMRMNCTGNR